MFYGGGFLRGFFTGKGNDMKIKKWAAIAAAGMMVAALGLFGCSSGGGSSSSSASSSADDTAATEEITLVTDGVLTVGVSPDYPPFENVEDGEYVGFDIDFAKALAEELGLECEFKTLNFDGILTAVAAGGQCDVGISGISVDPERAQQVDFSDSYYVDDQAVAVMKGGSITADNADEALNSADVTIAVQSGSTGETFARENFPNATIMPYTNATDCFAAMQSGQADAVSMNNAVVKQMLAAAYQDAEIVKTVATGEDYAVAVSKDNTALLDAINAAIAKMTANGTMDEINAKNFG